MGRAISGAGILAHEGTGQASTDLAIAGIAYAMGVTVRVGPRVAFCRVFESAYAPLEPVRIARNVALPVIKVRALSMEPRPSLAGAPPRKTTDRQPASPLKPSSCEC